jgi:GTP pyrophosphokinase
LGKFLAWDLSLLAWDLSKGIKIEFGNAGIKCKIDRNLKVKIFYVGAIIVVSTENYHSKTTNINPLENLSKGDLNVSQLEFENGLVVAEIVNSLNIDDESVIGGFLYGLGAVRDVELGIVEEKFGTEPILLYQKAFNLLTLSSFQTFAVDQKNSEIVEENLRKMVIAMVDDVRVAVIFLSGHLQLLRSSKESSPEIRHQHAIAGRELVAPLANRLGLWQLKWEIEDLSFRYLHPNSYKTLARALEEKRVNREKYIEELVDKINNDLQVQGINSQVRGRAKHIYSIWKKMQHKGLEFNQLWDLRALRIVVANVEECYQSLGLIHSKWEHYQSEFEDYVATPKENGYRSIHTIIKGPENKSVEIQIRTKEMHENSELGLAAHWRYKESVSENSASDNKVVWLRQLLDWKDQLIDSNSKSETPSPSVSVPVKSNETRVYVFTPKGTVVDLPNGSTPVDFAYSVHTEIGHRTRRAIVNGKMVPLHYTLITGDKIQIQTVNSGGPSLDWLRDEPLYVKTSRARNRISQWHKHQEYDHYVAEGRALLDKEIIRLGLEDISYEKINGHTHFHKIDDLFAALGAQDYKISKALYPFKKHQNQDAEVISVPTKHQNKNKLGAKSEFIVQGVGNLLTQLAHCCDPVPGDKIIGYITMGKGVSIHRKLCTNIVNIDAQHRDRLIDVDWGTKEYSSYTLNIVVKGYHRSGLLHDITEYLKSSKADILKASMETDNEHVTVINMRLEVAGEFRPDQIIQKLTSIENVFEVKRGG